MLHLTDERGLAKRSDGAALSLQKKEATRECRRSCVTTLAKKFALVLNFSREVLHRARVWPNIRAALRGVVPLVTSRNGGPDPLEVWHPK